MFREPHLLDMARERQRELRRRVEQERLARVAELPASRRTDRAATPDLRVAVFRHP